MRRDILAADDERWRKALTSLRHDVYHLPDHMAIEARRDGADPVGVVAVDGGRRWAVPLLLRPVPGTGRFDASSPYGYPGPLSNAALSDSLFVEDALLALRDSLTSVGAISCFLRLHPFLGPPLESFKRAGALVVHGQTVVIDLDRSEEELWKGLRAGHRVQIRRALGRGVTVVEDEHWSRLTDRVSAYWATMERVGAREQYYLPLSYFESLHRCLDAAYLGLAPGDASGEHSSYFSAYRSAEGLLGTPEP